MRQKICLGMLWLCVVASAAQQRCPDKNSPSDVNAKVDALLARMTVAEKIGQLGDRAPAIPRLGIPAYNWWNEGLHGVARDGYATVFPQAIGLAATWDPELLQLVGEAVSIEARMHASRYAGKDSPRYAGLTIWSPNVNIFRDPRWGRGQETYGEDPYLTGRMGSAFVRGVQGTDSFYKRADATPKHFAVHSGPEIGRDSFNAVVSQHDLNDTYFAAFKEIITGAKPAALMCSYNAINGVPSCANGSNLQGLVRGRWGFDGYIVSDCDAVGNIHAYQHFAADAAEGAALALKAGVDLDCGNSYNALKSSLDRKLITEVDLDRSLRRLFTARMQLGNLSVTDCSPYAHAGSSDTAAHSRLALRASEESIVLLKNNGVLPLRANRRIAVVGPTADLLKVLEANYHGTAEHPVTLLQGLQMAFGPVAYAQGSLLAPELSIPVPRSAWRTDASPTASAGLRAEYLNGASFTGTAKLSRTVDKIDFDLDRVGPDPALTSRQYAARWSGVLQTPAAGDYALKVNVERCWDCTKHDRYTLFVDGRLVLQDDSEAKTQNTISLHDTSPTAHPVRLELTHEGDDEGISLEWTAPAKALLDQALEAANQADVIVACVGLSPDLEGEALPVALEGFAGGDRTTLGLPRSQLELVHALESLHKPLVLAVTSGSAVALGKLSDGAAAVLQLWYPGESGGTAFANVITGAANPSGRLPVTVYHSAADLPAFTDYSMADRTYRYFHGVVEHGFGFGLSYSTFRYGPPTVSRASMRAGVPFVVSTTVTNTSALDGNEVVQLYIKPPQLPGVPQIAMKGFQRIALRAHEQRVVQFSLSPDAISTVAPDGTRSVLQGTYAVFVGGSQPTIGAAGSTFTVLSGWPVKE